MPHKTVLTGGRYPLVVLLGFFASFQKREPKRKGWSKFALRKLLVRSYPVAQGV